MRPDHAIKIVIVMSFFAFILFTYLHFSDAGKKKEPNPAILFVGYFWGDGSDMKWGGLLHEFKSFPSYENIRDTLFTYLGCSGLVDKDKIKITSIYEFRNQDQVDKFNIGSSKGISRDRCYE